MTEDYDSRRVEYLEGCCSYLYWIGGLLSVALWKKARMSSRAWSPLLQLRFQWKCWVCMMTGYRWVNCDGWQVCTTLSIPLSGL